MSDRLEERAKEAHAFWLEVGRTLDVWQRAEQELSEIFVTVVQSTVDDVVRAAFYKVISINTKREMIAAALSVRVEDDELIKKWKTLSDRVKRHAQKRNALAHGTRWEQNHVSVMGPHMFDVQLREAHMRKNEGEYLDTKAINQMQKDFWLLAQSLHEYRQLVGNYVLSFGKPIHLPRGHI